MAINQNKKIKKKIGYILVAILAAGLMLTASILTIERPQIITNSQDTASNSGDNKNLVNTEQQVSISLERFRWRTPTSTPKTTTTPTPIVQPTPTPTPTQKIAPTAQPTQTPSQSTTTTKYPVGVNLLSTYHTYSPKYLTNDILNRDFAKFQKDGIAVISLSLYWYRIEGNTQGSYNDAFLSNVKNVITIANQYGIKVLVTFHTLWGDDSQWCTPDYVIDPVSGKNIGLAVVRSTEMRQAYIDMVDHSTGYLAGTPGVWAWAVLNEPWYWGRTANEHDFRTNNGQTQKENFITLTKELANTVKANDGRQVTVKFCNAKEYISSDGAPHIKNIFADDWKMDDRIFSALDFIGFNVYPAIYSENQVNWLSITNTNVESAQRNKPVWITEFGSKTNNQLAQANTYTNLMSFFNTLPIQGIIAWQWTAGTIPDTNSQSEWNLCSNRNTGAAKPAYNVLTSSS